MAGRGLRKEKRNVALRLARAEAGLLGRHLPILSAVPPRLQTPIEDILDSAGELKGCVLLGFTRDGGHLISYTLAPTAAAEGQEGDCLQLWTFDRHKPCHKLWSIALFRAGASVGQQEDEDFAAAASSLSLTVAETPGSELLVVHGRAAEVEGQASDRQLNHLTIIPGPKHASWVQQLQVAHMCYHTAAPHPPFNPFISLLSHPLPNMPTSSGPLPTVGLACNLGDGLRLLILTASSPPASPQRFERQGQGREQHDPGGGQHRRGSAGDSSGPPCPPANPGTGPLVGPMALEGLEDAVASHDTAAAISTVGQGRFSAVEQQPLPDLQAMHASSRITAAGASGGSEAPDGQQPEPDISHPADDLAAAEGLQQLRSEVDLCFVSIPCNSLPSCTTPAPRAAAGARQSAGSASTAAMTGLSSSSYSSVVAITGATVGGGSSSGHSTAAVSVLPAGPPLDWEDFIFREMRALGMPLHSLEDYGCALAAQGEWRGRRGLLGIALLALRGRQGSEGSGGQRCLLVHIAAASGLAEVVEVLEPPFPWEGDLSRARRQAGTAGLHLPLDRQAAYAADWLRCRCAAPSSRRHLPHVLTNRTVLEAGRSLKYIAHPWLPQCVLGYRSRSGR